MPKFDETFNEIESSVVTIPLTGICKLIKVMKRNFFEKRKERRNRNEIDEKEKKI